MDSLPLQPDSVPEGGEPNHRLEGTVDAFVAPELLASLKSAFTGAGVVRVDCSALERLDTSGLQILVAWANGLTEVGRVFSFEGVPDAVRTFIALAGAERILFPTRTETSGLQQTALSADECAVVASPGIGAAAEHDPLATAQSESGVAMRAPTHTGTDTVGGSETGTAAETETENYEQEASFG